MITAASYIDDAFIKDWYNALDTNISYMPTHREVVDKFNNLKPQSVYIIDEAIKVLDKQDWGNNLQRAIRQMYATERKQRKVTFLGMPRFADLAERFRNHRVRYWFRVIARGVYVVHKIDDEPDLGYYDPWHIKDNIKIKLAAYGRRNVVDRDVEAILAAERKLPTYWFDGTFESLPPDVEARYDELVAKYKALANVEESEQEKTTKKTRALRALCYNLWTQGMTLKEIADMTKALEYDAEGFSYVGISEQIFELTKQPLDVLKKKHGLGQEAEKVMKAL